jgi:hypothetical protein
MFQMPQTSSTQNYPALAFACDWWILANQETFKRYKNCWKNIFDQIFATGISPKMKS